MERTCVCCGCTLENDYDVYYVGNEALCEDCYDEMISRFCVPVETTESTELL